MSKKELETQQAYRGCVGEEGQTRRVSDGAWQ